MRQRRGLRATVLSTVAGVACLAFPATAAAADSLAVVPPADSLAAAPGGDPRGANGTVKIDGVPLDDGIANEPHVSCEFEVAFFNFDKGERANIVFTVHPPTGSGAELLRRDGVVVSTDPAGGGAPDPDETFRFTADQLGLDDYPAHPKQGYHVKLTVERIGAPGAGKHKVFWLAPCADSTTPPVSPTSPAGSTPEAPAPDATNPGGGAAGGGTDDGGLPITGPAAGGLALLGAALVGGGAALLVIRRRRRITWTA